MNFDQHHRFEMSSALNGNIVVTSNLDRGRTAQIIIVVNDNVPVLALGKQRDVGNLIHLHDHSKLNVIKALHVVWILQLLVFVLSAVALS